MPVENVRNGPVQGHSNYLHRKELELLEEEKKDPSAFGPTDGGSILF
jgi:hypothetical protein